LFYYIKMKTESESETKWIRALIKQNQILLWMFIQ
jgi:hypothetical protein